MDYDELVGNLKHLVSLFLSTAHEEREEADYANSPEDRGYNMGAADGLESAAADLEDLLKAVQTSRVLQRAKQRY